MYSSFSRLIRFLKPVDELRTSFQYNNLMYGLIAVVSETIGENTWEELMKEKLFKPLGIINATFVSNMNDNDEELVNVQVPYLPDVSGLKPVSWNVLRYALITLC